MRGKELLEQEQAEFITALLNVLKTDPMASDHEIMYEDTADYLWELIETNGSVLGGLIAAMERHLEK
jgi:hypothetical protein